MTKPALLPSHVKRAREMRRRGWSWDRIADYLNVARETVRCALDPEHKAKLQNWRKESKERFNAARRKRVRNTKNLGVLPGQLTASDFPSTQTNIPDGVLADRDRRAELEPASITAALLGDPLPGRSALDKRKPRIAVSNERDTA